MFVVVLLLFIVFYSTAIFSNAFFLSGCYLYFTGYDPVNSEFSNVTPDEMICYGLVWLVMSSILINECMIIIKYKLQELK